MKRNTQKAAKNTENRDPQPAGPACLNFFVIFAIFCADPSRSSTVRSVDSHEEEYTEDRKGRGECRPTARKLAFNCRRSTNEKIDLGRS
jgi:hypothetical protein